MSRSGREIKEVSPYLNPAGVPRCKVTFLGGEVEPLTSISRVELAAAARHTFPEHPGNVWQRFTSDELRGFIWGLATEPVQGRGAVAAAVLQKGHPAQPTTRTPGVGREPAPYVEKPQVPSDLDPAEAAIIEALRSRKGSVDIDQVRDIVRDEVQAAASMIGVTRIEVTRSEGPTVTIESPHEVFGEVLDLAQERENVFLVGPAGSGKSTIGEHLATALGLPFGAISFGPTTPTSKLFGFQNASGEFVGTEAHRVFTGGGVFLMDELDNGHPGLIAETNQMLANGYAAFACGMCKKHPDTIIVATGNTYGLGPDRVFVGRNQLDAATLNRFWSIECPIDEVLERRLALAWSTPETQSDVEAWVDYVVKVRRNVYANKLPVVVSPRDSISGAKMIARRGWTLDKCAERRLFAGLGGDIRAKIQP